MQGHRQYHKLAERGYTTVARDAALSSPDSTKQLVVHSLSAYNATNTAIDMGLGVRLQNASWKLYSIQAATTEVTSTIQAGSATTLLPTTNNYGFLVQAKKQFSMLSLTISQVETGSPTYSYQYWNGSSWATLNLRNTPVYTSAASIAIVFAPPVDWAEGNGSATDDFSVSETGYCIRVRGTTAPSQAVQATAMAVSSLWAFRNIAAYGSLNIGFADKPQLLEIGESVQPYFETANNGHSVEVAYQVNG